ncbi:filamentous hemagglutinin N-terminal domain-containing protein, partial [Campylobacter sp. IFREMER_LSEM_CL2090]|uniref:two-partner secretion domain-containing protein n=1 Tax=Campylobacter sp. IFREMER_LSEM_CL2090 TaxID=2911617 RepID=UPI0021E777A2
TVSMLFSPLMALPSGGKFTHGTSGSISGPYLNGGKNTIDVIGKTPGNNHVIQWGGGFSIGKGESVNFNGSNKNYLNIAHGTSKSTIAGILEAGNNNVFLINPNGVIITKTGTINANRFVTSTSSLKPEDFDKFKAQGASFSPVFKPNGGNVVNMGTINAKNITLQGNKVMLSADTSWDDKNNKIKLNQITADNIDLKGNEVYVDISTINSNSLTTEAKNKGIAYLSATGYYYNPNSFKVFDKYTNTNDDNFKVYKYVGIGSDLDWWHFAKGWNENEDFRNTASGYRLTNNIDFKASNGQNHANYWVDLNGDGKKDANEFTNMIVGYKYDSVFTKTFDGQGFTLKNINIDTTGFFYPGKYNLSEYVGIFGKADGAKFKNINVDYMGGSVKAYGYGGDEEYIYIQKYTGGFAGSIENSEIDSINLKNLTYISTSSDKSKIGSIYLGGFVGDIRKTNASNVVLNNIGIIEAIGNAVSTPINTGGFAGLISGGREFMYIKDIALENIDNIIAINTAGGSQDLSAGGFAGVIDSMAKDGYISHVKLNNINNIKSGSEDKIDGNINAGGFVGRVKVSENFNIKDIVVKNINHIYTGKSSLSESNSGGFAGSAFLNGWKNMFFRNIFIENIGNITSNNNSGGFIGSDSYGGANYVDITIKDIDNILSTKNSGGFVGFNNGGKYSKIYISDIKNISSKSIDKFDNLSNSFNYASGFIGFNNYGEFSDITVKNIGNISSISNGLAYSGGFVGGFVGGFDSGEFKRISLENITNINSISKSTSSYAGGFAGGSINNPYASFYFTNIYLKDILNISSHGEMSISGGFAGEIVNTVEDNSIVFDRISIDNINNIEAKGGYYAVSGGFLGELASFSTIKDIKLSNIDKIKVESLGTGSASIGGFAGRISRSSKFENIVLNNFGNIIGKDFVGGFVGEISSSSSSNPNEFNNISLNNFGNIIGKDSVGGFVGFDTRAKMSNISLNNIDYIQGTYAGGFTGKGLGNYGNIALNNIKYIQGTYAGGFAGFGTGGKNIYIF